MGMWLVLIRDVKVGPGTFPLMSFPFAALGSKSEKNPTKSDSHNSEPACAGQVVWALVVQKPNLAQWSHS